MSLIKQVLALAGAACLLSASLHAQSSFADDFNRADGTDLGSDWTEAVGDWEIFGNVARSHDWDLATEKILVHDAIVIDRAFSLEADIGWLELRNQWNGIIWNVSGTNTYYLFRTRSDSGAVQIIKRIDGKNALVPVNTGNGGVTIPEGVSARMKIQGDGTGNFWWSISNGEELLANGNFSDAEPLAGGTSGIYGGRESILVDNFSVETFDLTAEVADLGIRTAVEIFFTTSAGSFYQIQSSPDLAEWTVEGELIQGDGLEVSRLFSTRGGDRKFFRVITSLEQP